MEEQATLAAETKLTDQQPTVTYTLKKDDRDLLLTLIKQNNEMLKNYRDAGKLPDLTWENKQTFIEANFEKTKRKFTVTWESLDGPFFLNGQDKKGTPIVLQFKEMQTATKVAALIAYE